MITKQVGQNSSGCRVPGLDTLRILALLLVTWQHAATVLGAYAETQWRGISPGQTGVSMFCAISGYLAFRTTPRSANDWLARRLIGIFPLYWVVTLLAFALTIVVGTDKPITVWLFVSQMLGLGYFTHGWQLVNVVSWYVSLILLCYILSFAARKLGKTEAFWLLVVAITLFLVVTRLEVAMSRHVLTFALGALFGMHTTRLWPAGAVVALLIGAGISLDPQVFYAGFGLLMLGIATKGWVWEAPVIKRMATYSYEYFLIHGIFLVAATKFIQNAIFSVFVAVLASSISAVVLSKLDRKLRLVSRIQHHA